MTLRVEVLRDATGNVLDVRSADDLKRRPWAAGDLASFGLVREEWPEEDYDEHRAPNAAESAALVDATIEEFTAEARRRGYDLKKIMDVLLPDGGL